MKKKSVTRSATTSGTRTTSKTHSSRTISSMILTKVVLDDSALPVAVLLSFNKVKSITADTSVLYSALEKFENSSMCTYSLLRDKQKIYKRGLGAVSGATN